MGIASALDEGPVVTVGRVSVLIPQWGKTDLTVRCIESVMRSEELEALEIIVLDNGSPEGPGAVAEMDGITLLQNEENQGFTRAHNRMAEEATGEYLLLLNNDTIVDSHCIANLVTALGESDQAGMAAPLYRAFSGDVLELGSYLGTAGEGWQFYRSLSPPDSFLKLPLVAHYSSAAALMVRASEFSEMGGFDDAFSPAYYEDTDLAMRYRERGQECLIVPSAVCFHFEGATGGSDVSGSGMKRYQAAHRSLFVERWLDELAGFGGVSLSDSFGHALDARDGMRVLWVSPHLPRVDREAGHRRMVHMIEALRRSGHAVAFWAEHANDDARYGSLLEAMGVRWFGSPSDRRWNLPPSRPRPFVGLDELLVAAPWDVVVISFPSLAERFTERVRELAPQAALIVDSTDLHFVREERSGADPDTGMTKRRELGIYEAADGVIAASTAETEILLDEVPGIQSFPFAVAAEPPSPDRGAELATNLVFLANFAHDPNVDAVRWWVDEIRAAVTELSDTPIRLRVVGAGTDLYGGVWQPERDGVELGGWVPDLDEEFATTRLFLAPLRFGAGTKGKITEAVARGVPVATTTIGAEGFDDEFSSSLLVSDDARELAEVIVRMMHDEEAWLAQRRIARDQAERLWRKQQAIAVELADWVERRATSSE